MVDRERVLARLDDLDGYLRELRSIAPVRFEEYLPVTKRRACERLLQICVEAVIDTCALLVTGLRLGLPAEEDDLFTRLDQRGVLTTATMETLRRMKGLRNLLVQEYGRIDDRIVFETIDRHLADSDTFKGRCSPSCAGRRAAESSHTRRSGPKPVAALHEEVESRSTLPVFQEIPARSHDWTSAVADDAAAQQRQ